MICPRCGKAMHKAGKPKSGGVVVPQHATQRWMCSCGKTTTKQPEASK